MKKNENNKTAKVVCGIIVVVMIAGILYLTFQSPQQTIELSETVRIWLKNMGWEMTPKQIRSYVHIPMYFLLGLSVFIFGLMVKWKWYISLLLAMSIALLDEGIKGFLPTREFDFRDLFKDFSGIGIAGLLTFLLFRIKANIPRDRKIQYE